MGERGTDKWDLHDEEFGRFVAILKPTVIVWVPPCRNGTPWCGIRFHTWTDVNCIHRMGDSVISLRREEGYSEM